MTPKFAINPYEKLLEIGAKMDSHESDLYVKATPEAWKIIRASGWSCTIFTDQIDKETWYELPFAYLPYWKGRTQRRAADELPERDFYEGDSLDY
jgi:hypothetical protein